MAGRYRMSTAIAWVRFSSKGFVSLCNLGETMVELAARRCLHAILRQDSANPNDSRKSRFC
jgi:hypothetical protein